MSVTPTAFEDCVVSEYIWRQATLRRFTDTVADADLLGKTDCDHVDMPLYFGTPSTDGNLIHLAKVGFGSMNLAVYADTVPLDVKHTLGVT
jgi:hypothetical protein